MRVTQSDIQAFADWSRDRNPLHVDPAFAQRTFFGGSIAHGMLSVVVAAAEGERTRSATPTSLEIEFKGAIRPDALYHVDIADQGTAIERAVRSPEGTLLTIRGGADAAPAPIDASWLATPSPSGPLRDEPIRRDQTCR